MTFLSESQDTEMIKFYDAFREFHEFTKIPYYIPDIFKDDECWDKSNTVVGIKLKRRLVAQKMIEPRIWNGRSNIEEDFKCFQFACWCCLEDDVIALMGHFKEKFNIHTYDADSLQTLIKLVMGLINGDEVNDEIDPMLKYWCYAASGNVYCLNLDDCHPYVYGMHIALNTERIRVEAVEYFWNRIQSLSECELNEKDDVLLQFAVKASRYIKHPEVFEYCFNQISPDKFRQLLDLDFKYKGKGIYGTLDILIYALRCDLFQRLFDCLEPSDIDGDYYFSLIEVIGSVACIGKDAWTRIFMYLWTKEGFDEHRAEVLEIIYNFSRLSGSILDDFIRAKNFKPLWAILDKFNPEQIKIFMNSQVSNEIQTDLKRYESKVTLDKFLAYM